MFLEICPGEERSMKVLDELIQKHVAIGIWLFQTSLQNLCTLSIEQGRIFVQTCGVGITTSRTLATPTAQ